MQSHKSLMTSLILSLCALGVSGCATSGAGLQTFPPAALLSPPPKPVPTDDIVTSAQAHARYDIAVEDWGQAASDQVQALCVWAKTRGFKDAPC